VVAAADLCVALAHQAIYFRLSAPLLVGPRLALPLRLLGPALRVRLGRFPRLALVFRPSRSLLLPFRLLGPALRVCLRTFPPLALFFPPPRRLLLPSPPLGPALRIRLAHLLRFALLFGFLGGEPISLRFLGLAPRVFGRPRFLHSGRIGPLYPRRPAP